jgi:hypothetical protein
MARDTDLPDDTGTMDMDDDAVRGRADEMDDADETDEFDDTEDLDEEEEEGEGSF